MPKMDIVGNLYGKLTVLGQGKKVKTITKCGRKKWTQMYDCQCDCGKILSFVRSEITGHKHSMCPDCKQQLIEERAEQGRSPSGMKIRGEGEDCDRSTVRGFCEYFPENKYMFRDIFEVDYTDAVAAEKFNQIFIDGPMGRMEEEEE